MVKGCINNPPPKQSHSSKENVMPIIYIDPLNLGTPVRIDTEDFSQCEPIYDNKGVNNAFYGMSHTEEHKKALSEANSGERNYNYGRRYSAEKRKEFAGFKGRHHTEEAKKKISEANRGRKLPPRTAEHTKKLGETQKGNKHCVGRIMSKETRRKIALGRFKFEQAKKD